MNEPDAAGMSRSRCTGLRVMAQKPKTLREQTLLLHFCDSAKARPFILGGTYVGGFLESRAAKRAGDNSNNLKDSWLWQKPKGIPESSCEAIAVVLGPISWILVLHTLKLGGRHWPMTAGAFLFRASSKRTRY